VADISRDLWALVKNSGYESFIFQQGKSLLDAEVNTIQSIIKFRLEEITKRAIGKGTIGTDFEVYASSNANEIKIKKGIFVHEGKMIRIPSDVTVTGLNTPVGSDRTDVVFAEWFIDEIDYTEDSNLLDPSLGLETVRADKIDVQIKVAEGIDPNPTAGKSYFQIATLNRLDGIATVATSQIQDDRRKTSNTYVTEGLEVTDGGGLNVDISTGYASVGDVELWPDAQTGVSVSASSTVYISLLQNGTINSSTTEPTAYHTLLATVVTDGASVVSITDNREWRPGADKGGFGNKFYAPGGDIEAQAGSNERAFETGEAISAYDVVKLSSTAETVYKSQSNTVNQNDMAVAIAPKSILINTKDTFLMRGFIENSAWTWTQNAVLYVSYSTAGGLTETPPTVANAPAFSQAVAIAVTPTLIYFDPDKIQTIFQA